MGDRHTQSLRFCLCANEPWNFRWDFSRYKKLEEYKGFGKFAYLVSLRNGIWRNMGGCLAPMNAFLNITGMETLGLRMQRICENALELSRTVGGLPGVTVNYPALDESPYVSLVRQQLRGLGGGIFTIRVGSKAKAYAILNRLKYALNATNIGDVRTLVIHPASTIFIHSNEQQKAAAGVYEDMIRVSVGIEDIHDLTQDFISAICG